MVSNLIEAVEDEGTAEGGMTDGESYIKSTPEMYSAIEGTVALQMENKKRLKLNQQHHNEVPEQPVATDFW